MANPAVVRLTNLSKSYRLGSVHVRALGGVTLDIAHGEFIALAGPSGSGKTTLLNLTGCIDKPDEGRVVVDDVDVTAVPFRRLAALRRDALGFFQTFNLIPVLTAYENVEYSLLLERAAPGARRAREPVARASRPGRSGRAAPGSTLRRTAPARGHRPSAPT